jgi:hypothetical protein
MNVATMQMEPHEARRLYIEYRKSVRALRDARRRLAEIEAKRHVLPALDELLKNGKMPPLLPGAP